MLAACGSGGGGKDDKTVTIWSSIDQPVQDGLKKVLTKEAKADGITIKWQKVDNINQLIMQKIQANDVPDIAFIPQPGVVGDIVKRNAAIPLDDVVDMDALKSDMIPGTLEAGTVDGKLYGLLVSTNVKSLVFYPKKAWDSAGYTAPDRPHAPRRAHRQDQVRRQHARGAWASSPTPAPAGRPPTGSRTWSCASAAPTSTTSGSPTRSSSTRPMVKKAADEFEQAALHRRATSLGGRKAIASTNFGTAGNPMFDAKPGCCMYKQGSFITGLLPARASSPTSTRTSASSASRRRTAGGDNPILGGGDMATLLNDTDSRPRRS